MSWEETCLMECLCGCGGIPKQKQSKYIQGHTSRIEGLNHFKKSWHNPWNRGLTKETNNILALVSKKVSETKKRKFANRELLPWDKGLTKDQLPDSMYSKERNKKVSLSNTGKHLTKETCMKISETRNKRIALSEITYDLEKMSKTTSELWQNENYVRHQMKARLVSQNNTEKFVYNILRGINPKYIFSGDGSVILKGKSPDFIEKDEKHIIEFLGCYWHHCPKCRPELVEEDDQFKLFNRNNHFEKLGYKVLYIWEHELKNINSLKEKINLFENSEAIA